MSYAAVRGLPMPSQIQSEPVEQIRSGEDETHLLVDRILVVQLVDE